MTDGIGWVEPMGFGEIVEPPDAPQTIKLSDLKPPRDPFAEFLTDLRDRLVAVEARQRAYGQHDPDCPRFTDVRKLCACWLSRPHEVVHLIADGEAVTSCCGRTPFELPRTERISVDPKLGNCKGRP